MKAAKFDYQRPTSLQEAVAALATEGTKVLAGGQSLGAMLNLRLARLTRLVDVGRLPPLRAVAERPDAVEYGAALTHAEFEDGTVPDPTFGVLPAVARGIAYRAVRNRGTIGGSLAHADPAADWPVALAALGASVRIAGPSGERCIAVEDLIVGAFETCLAPQEIIVAVVVPRLSRERGWSYVKSCRKVGEFAEAMTAVLADPARGVHRLVVGALEARAVVVGRAEQALHEPRALEAALAAAGLPLHRPGFALHRAVADRAIAALDHARVTA